MINPDTCDAVVSSESCWLCVLRCKWLQLIPLCALIWMRIFQLYCWGTPWASGAPVLIHLCWKWRGDCRPSAMITYLYFHCFKKVHVQTTCQVHVLYIVHGICIAPGRTKSSITVARCLLCIQGIQLPFVFLSVLSKLVTARTSRLVCVILHTMVVSVWVGAHNNSSSRRPHQESRPHLCLKLTKMFGRASASN